MTQQQGQLTNSLPYVIPLKLKRACLNLQFQELSPRGMLPQPQQSNSLGISSKLVTDCWAPVSQFADMHLSMVLSVRLYY